MLSAAVIDSPRPVLKPISENQLIEMVKDKRFPIWVNIEGVEDQDSRLLQSLFQIHPLAIKDSTRQRHPPKYEHFQRYQYLLLRTLQPSNQRYEPSFGQLSMFLSDQFLITRHPKPYSTEELLKTEESGEFDPAEAVLHLAYIICHTIADQYIQVVLDIEPRLEQIEDEIDSDEQDVYIYELTSIKKVFRKITRNLNYHQRLLAELIKVNEQSWPRQVFHEYTDVYEQMERGTSLALMHDELCSDLINSYISINSHKTNRIVKILTIFTVMFLPLSFIAGLYGMNFQNMPELELKYGYFYALGAMVSVEIGMIMLLRKIQWL